MASVHADRQGCLKTTQATRDLIWGLCALLAAIGLACGGTSEPTPPTEVTQAATATPTRAPTSTSTPDPTVNGGEIMYHLGGRALRCGV
jgi:hypothetical protein